MEDEEYKADEFQMNVAVSNFSAANKQRGETSNESRGILKNYYEKILFYSAGGFAFQISLLQFIPDRHILAKPVIFGIPNIYLMYTSMAFYLIAAALVLLSRRFDAYYISASSTENYIKKYIEQQERILVMFQKYPGYQIVAGGPEEKKASLKEDVRLLKKMLPKSEQGNKLWYEMMKTSSFATEFFVGVATLLLFIVSAQLAQNLVW